MDDGIIPETGKDSSGIYRISVARPGKSELFYYGQSQNTRRREQSHRSDLSRGRHANVRLQRAFDKYGNLEFTVVCAAPPHLLDWVEQAFLDVYARSEDCLNLALVAGSPMRGRKHSEETRAKYSRDRKGFKLSDEHRAKLLAASVGRVVSDETKAKLRAKLVGRPLSGSTREKMSEARRAAAPTYTWVHPEHGILTAKPWELGTLYPELNVGHMCSVQTGKRRSHKGWKKHCPEG